MLHAPVVRVTCPGVSGALSLYRIPALGLPVVSTYIGLFRASEP